MIDSIEELRRLQQIILYIIGPMVFLIGCVVWFYAFRVMMRNKEREQ